MQLESIVFGNNKSLDTAPKPDDDKEEEEEEEDDKEDEDEKEEEDDVERICILLFICSCT
jgi:hypothetical protein